MAEALNILDTSYAGEAASFMLTPAVIDIDTIKKGAINIITGIKKAHRIPTLDVINVVQPRQATPVSAGQINVSAVLLEPQDYMIYLEFNPRDFEQHWYAEELGESLIDEQLPPTAESYLLYQLLKRANEFNENSIWRAREEFNPANGGVTPASKNQAAGDAYFQYFNGLIYKLLNDPTTIEVTGTTLTSSNILTYMQNCYQAIPFAILNRLDDIKFCMNYDTQRFYNEALASLTYKDTFNTDATKQQYKGYEIKALAGLPDNTIVVALAIDTDEAAFWLGVNSDKDSSQIKFDKVSSPSELYYCKMLFKADVNYSFATQTVLCTNILA
jgi:hypothetical protein